MIHRGGYGNYRTAGGVVTPIAFRQASGAQSVVSAEIGTVDATTLVLTGNRDWSATGDDYTTGLTVSVNGSGATIVSATRQSNTKLLYVVLSAAVVYGDTVTVSYDSATGHITGLASFTGQSVTNNVSSLLTGLSGYWKLDELSGARADSSGKGNHLADSGSTGYTLGKVGNAANLAGSTYLSHADEANLNVYNTSFTVDGWLYLNSTATLQVIVGKDDAPGNSRQWVLFYYTDGLLYFQVYDLNGVEANVACTTFGTLSIHTWYYFRCWRDIADNKIYISVNNGAADSGAGKAIPDQAASFRVGGYGAGQYLLTGLVDEVGLWKKLFLPAEATARYNGGAGNTHPFRASDTAWMDNIVCEGDSITYQGDANTWPLKLVGLYTVPVVLTNLAESGDTIANIVATEGASADVCYHAQYRRNLAILLAGTNDIGTNGATAATVWTNLKAWCAARKATGFTTVLLTLTPRAYLGDAPDVQTRIDALNVLIRGGDTSIDTVIDIAADSRLDDPTDGTYYYDGLHLQDAGRTVVAALVKAAL